MIPRHLLHLELFCRDSVLYGFHDILNMSFLRQRLLGLFFILGIHDLAFHLVEIGWLAMFRRCG